MTRNVVWRYAIFAFIAALLGTPIAASNSAVMFAAEDEAALPLAAPSSWAGDLYADSPLVGKIWSFKKQALITPEELLADLNSARYVLLGELHDNADHHTLQARIMGALGKEAKTSNKPAPAVVMEMIRVDQMRRLNAYLETAKPKAKYLGNALEWEQNGWPAWAIYQPIGEEIFKYNMEIYPGHTSRMQINHLIKSDLSILPEKARETFRLNIPLSEPKTKSLMQEIRDAHCDRLPENVIKPMSDVQRFRDAWMADVLIQASETEDGKDRQSILIAGKGHTRIDRGAPWYLEKRTPDQKGLVVHFIEANATAKSMNDLLAARGISTKDKEKRADYFWVTPSLKRGDPCENIPDFGKKD